MDNSRIQWTALLAYSAPRSVNVYSNFKKTFNLEGADHGYADHPQDYNEWRPGFNRHARAQQSAGLTNPRVFRSSDNQNEVIILFDTDDTKKAKDFLASPDLKETMVKAGVTDRPTVYFLESAEPLRVMGTGWIELLGLHGLNES